MHLENVRRKFPMYSFRIGFREQRMCLRLFTLHSSGNDLNGVTCSHVDDMLKTSSEVFESKLKKFDKLIGFGSMMRRKFDHCRETAREQNLRKACLILERT